MLFLDGLAYTEKVPHSRIEKLLYDILNGGGGGGGDIVVDDPSDVGNGLMVSNDTLKINASNDVMDDNELPVTSGAVQHQLSLVDIIMGRI